jgi:hypothetical protein
MLNTILLVLILIKTSLKVRFELCLLCVIVLVVLKYKVEYIKVESRVVNRCNT